MNSPLDYRNIPFSALTSSKWGMALYFDIAKCHQTAWWKLRHTYGENYKNQGVALTIPRFPLKESCPHTCGES